MLRLLHTADVHLGARHTDLGERAAMLRERQFAAFRVTVDLAIAEKVDMFLVAGDLFDSNTQPRRSVERVAAELGRLTRSSIRTVIIPGTHDVYDGASIYRSYDLAALAKASSDWVVVLTRARPDVFFETLDAVVYGRVFDTKKSSRSPLAGLDAKADDRGTWKIGMIHGSLAIPGKTENDEVVFTEEEISRTNLDYLAMGHWHSAIEGRAGSVAYAYPGAPEPVAVSQDGAGQVLLVTMDDRGGRHSVSIEAKRVGQTRFEKLELDVSAVRSQPELIEQVNRLADNNLILEVRLTGLMPDQLDIDLEEIERALAPSFLHFRIVDVSIPSLPEAPPPPEDTVLGAFMRLVEAKIRSLEAGGEPGSGFDFAVEGADEIDDAEAGPPARRPARTPTAKEAPGTDDPDQARAQELADLREVMRLGRHLLEGRQVTL
jgi:DNA repair exonuclease SbcCD nuclease subunit